jgi:hypothetical protein
MNETRESKVMALIARIWCIASIVFVLAFVVGEALNGNGTTPTPIEWIALALFPGGVVVGLAIAWFRKGLGGGITIASLIGFYLWLFLERGRFPGGPYFALVAAPGFLFVLSSLLSRPRRLMRSA